ncbi:hypothetical protein [Fulvivirga sediminis]|uniref:WD40 repeat domain-containing protein n=1 Tax=Fulvivirga sediminis TaxID=2803949 RepID=A0A937JXB5_9BACT|nr:hypothetical protein [Fulvivirga sediminis]MBL3655328.1 hypothetical protein [Fulvivirga sediminis]
MKYNYLGFIKDKLISVGGDKIIRVHDLENHSRSVIREVNLALDDDESLPTLVYLEHLNVVAIGRKNGIVQLIDFDSIKILREFHLPLSDNYYKGWGVMVMNMSPDQRILIIGQTWYTAYPLNIDSGSTKEISISAQPIAIKYSNDFKLVGVFHAEQGGQGLDIYKLISETNWEKLIDFWSINAFNFSSDSRKLIIFGKNENSLFQLKCLDINDFSVDWELEFSLADLGNDNIHDYGFLIGFIEVIQSTVCFAINSKVFFIKNGIIEKEEFCDYHIEAITKRKNQLWIATENEIKVYSNV